MAVRSRILSGVALLLATVGACHYAFAVGRGATAPPRAPSSHIGRSVAAPLRPAGGSQAGAPEPARSSRSSAGAAAALALGAAGTLAVVSAAARRGSTGQASLRARVCAKVASNAPSLIQVLEQKKLLSLVENFGLLSGAEKAGIRADLPERLGLLVLAERLGLLSLAETVVTNPGTPTTLGAGGVFLAALTFFDVTGGEDLGFLQWVLAGAFGTGALILLGAAVVIAGITSGTRRTKDIDVEETIYYVNANGGFEEEQRTRSVSLINSLEEKQLLSAVENYGLLSLGTLVLGKPLTTTEQLKVLSTLEGTGLLSQLESECTDDLAGLKYLVIGGLFLFLALIQPFGLIGALLVGAPALLPIGYGIVVGSLSNSKRPAASR